MSAALRLLESGFHVRMYEQDDFVGGMLHSYWDDTTQTMREHGYHMMPNFYFNFWKLVGELGLEDNFVPREGMRFLHGDDIANLPAMYNPSGPQDFLRNLTGDAEPPPDLFIYMYSMIDILAQPADQDDKLDDVSVTGFLRSRPYMTDEAMKLHQTMWQTVWGISSDQASMKSYRAFIKYSNRYSVPEFWFLNGNKWDHLIRPWLERLQGYGDRFELSLLHRLEQVHVDPAAKSIQSLEFRRVDRSPSVNVGRWQAYGAPELVDVSDDAVIISVTPGAIKGLVHGDLYNIAPKLGEVQYLSAAPIGNLQLRLKRKVELPSDITEFPDAPYSMTFLDFTQIWTDLDTTMLNVSVSDPVGLMSLDPEHRNDDGELIIDLDAPTTALEYVLKEVLAALRSLPITLDDVDLRRTLYDVLTGEELFANMAGSWARRPETSTPVSNLWLAGTYVKNPIDVATIEGAVMTGAMAAEAVRRDRASGEPPVTVLQPEEFPVEMYQALRIAWTPFVGMAKLWASSNSFFGRSGLGWNRIQRQVIAAGVAVLKPYLGRVPNPPEYLGPMNWPGTARNLPDDDPLAIGPVYWQYRKDGTRKPPTKSA
jgi:uncharacterized protein with NAD-binding domain and iron-sulfur cluster